MARRLQKDRGRTMKKKLLAVVLAAAMLLMTGCEILPAALSGKTSETPVQQPAATIAPQSAATPAPLPTAEPVSVVPSGEAVILFTGDVHCGIDQGFGYAGLQQLRDYLLGQGDEVILVDSGDAIQGEPIGTISKGEAVVDLMNELGYEIAVPGNHEFDYGMDRFLELTEKANFTYVSSNINQDGQLLLAPYATRLLAGHLVAFVGVTTPKTLTDSTPRYFQNEEGKLIYSFYQGDNGRSLYNSVQKSVDNARIEGAEYVVVLAHLGNDDTNRPWTCADLIANTSGINAVLDGHSHDTEQLVLTNKNGEDVLRVACGAKLSNIGYCRIDAAGELSVGLFGWPNEIPASDMLGIRNEMSEAVDNALSLLDSQLSEVFASARVELTISDPLAIDNSGSPIRLIRRAETNLGDLCADAYRIRTGADVAIVSADSICTSIPAGDITYGDVLRVQPSGNSLSVIEVTGLQILDALEWSARELPGENGSFLQVSGLTYEVHSYLNDCILTNNDGMFKSVWGQRRVQNAMINGEPIGFYKTYKLVCSDCILHNYESGFTMFDTAKVLQDSVMLDNQALLEYIEETLDGVIGDEYAAPYGQGRIVIYESAP